MYGNGYFLLPISDWNANKRKRKKMTNAQRWINRKRKIYKQKGDAFTNNNVRNELDMAMYNQPYRVRFGRCYS